MESFEGPRACQPLELAPTLDLINHVFRTSGATTGSPRLPTMGWDYTHIYHPGNLENVRIMLHDGRVVCSVGIYPNEVVTPRGTVRVGGINAVATHPEYRRQGLASLTMEDAAARMQSEGLHVGLLGTGIPDWYRKLGWETAGRQYSFTFDRGNIALLPEPVEYTVSEDWREHLDALCALHDAAPVGTRRTPAVFELLAARKSPRVLVAERRGEVVAYVALSGASVREYGGEVGHVAALLRAAFELLDNRSIRTSERAAGQRPTIELSVQTPVHSDGLPGLLLARGIPFALRYDGLLKLLDAPGLFVALGLGEVALEPRDAGWRLRHQGRTLDLTEHQLVKLVFGPERFPDFAPHLFPVPFYQWPLDHV